MSPSCAEHGPIGNAVLVSLIVFSKLSGTGKACGDNAGFLCDLLPRKSYSPDVAWYVGPIPENRLKFLPQPPAFSVEIRSENDFGAAAERKMAAQRADHFAVGT